MHDRAFRGHLTKLSIQPKITPCNFSQSKPAPCGLIFYSLGNFVFDQMWSQETREGLMVKFQITNNKLQMAELIPIIIDNYCCPRLANDEEAKNILQKINLISPAIQF